MVSAQLFSTVAVESTEVLSEERGPWPWLVWCPSLEIEEDNAIELDFSLQHQPLSIASRVLRSLIVDGRPVQAFVDCPDGRLVEVTVRP